MALTQEPWWSDLFMEVCWGGYFILKKKHVRHIFEVIHPDQYLPPQNSNEEVLLEGESNL